MRIGLLVSFAGRNCGGPEVFERAIVRAFHAVAPQHEYHLYCLDRRAPSVIGLQDRGIVYHLLRPSMRVLSMLASLPRAIARSRPAVFHAPMIPPPFWPANTVLSLSCSSMIHHPELYPPLVRMRLRFLLDRAIPRVRRVICLSHHIRLAVQDAFHLPPDRLPVIYPGVSRVFRPVPEPALRPYLEDHYGIRGPYFLFSGRWEPRKNIVRILEAFAQLRREAKTPHQLVFTGSRTWAAAEADRAIARLDLADAILDLGKTPMDELPYLYAGATALVYPSLWEGFGLPIVEAMACGTPVITSNVAAMPETAASAALLVDPYSTEDIAAAMFRIARDAGLRNELRMRGLERARGFSWERTASQTLQVYEEVAAEGPSSAAG